MRVKPLALILLVFLTPLAYIVQASVNVDPDYCSVTQLDSIYIACRDEVLFTDHGLWIDVDPPVNYVVIHRVFDSSFTPRIQIILNNVSESKFYVRLPPLREYAYRTVVAWNLTVFYYYNETIQEANYILKPDTWTQSGWEWTFGELVVVAIRLKPITSEQPVSEQPIAPPPPSATDFLGWLNYLIYLLVQVGKSVGVALSIFAVATGYLLQIAPLLLAAVPLHILAAFVHDPVEGVKTLNFYIGLARKIIDLLIQVFHALVELIGQLIPL